VPQKVSRKERKKRRQTRDAEDRARVQEHTEAMRLQLLAEHLPESGVLPCPKRSVVESEEPAKRPVSRPKSVRPTLVFDGRRSPSDTQDE